MNIYSSSQIKDNKIRYEIKGGGTSARSFRTWDNQVLKVFMNNDIYKMVLDDHNGDFLSYLIELSKIDNPALVGTNDVYTTKNGIVTAYKYPYQDGHTLYHMSKQVNLDEFMDAIAEFYGYIVKVENFRIGDGHARNILYNRLRKMKKIVLKFIDLDRCTFTDKDERAFNIKKLDMTIFKSMFYIPSELDTCINDERVRPLYKSFEHHELNIIGFLEEYRKFIIDNYGKCEAIKHLNRGIIVPQDPNQAF